MQHSVLINPNSYMQEYRERAWNGRSELVSKRRLIGRWNKKRIFDASDRDHHVPSTLDFDEEKLRNRMQSRGRVI
jgi:hypothetical protein